ncbi:MAG: amidohydrolase family protein, partial [Firmicutes bacterium]|nr:amidohydrolase family protein [Bacillota bacterium]
KTGVAMVVNGGKIEGFVDAATVDSEYKADEVLDLKDHVIFPGLIDAHMHSLDNVLRGLAQDTNNWMMLALQPFVNAAEHDEKVKGSRVAIIEAIKAGTTCLGD